MHAARRYPARALLWGMGASLILIAGCATIERQEAEEDERLLAAAGFTMLVADTPEKEAQVRAMKQRKMLRRTQDGQLHFIYVDADYCDCMFVGTQANYQQYQRLSLKREIAVAKQEAALDADEGGPYAWGMWGYPGW